MYRGTDGETWTFTILKHELVRNDIGDYEKATASVEAEHRQRTVP